MKCHTICSLRIFLFCSTHFKLIQCSVLLCPHDKLRFASAQVQFASVARAVHRIRKWKTPSINNKWPILPLGSNSTASVNVLCQTSALLQHLNQTNYKRLIPFSNIRLMAALYRWRSRVLLYVHDSRFQIFAQFWFAISDDRDRFWTLLPFHGLSPLCPCSWR